MQPKEVNDLGFEEAVIELDGLVIIGFLRMDLPVCRYFLLELQKLEGIIEGQVTVRWIDVWENPDMAEENGVTHTPATLVFRDAEEIARYEGPYSALSLKQRIELQNEKLDQ